MELFLHYVCWKANNKHKKKYRQLFFVLVYETLYNINNIFLLAERIFWMLK